MKAFEFCDVYKGMRLIRQANLKEQLKPVLAKVANGNVDIEDIGIEAIMAAVGSLAEQESEKAMYDLLSGPFEMDPEEVRHLSAMSLIEKIQWLWEEGELKAFCKALSDMMSLKSMNS